MSTVCVDKTDLIEHFPLLLSNSGDFIVVTPPLDKFPFKTLRTLTLSLKLDFLLGHKRCVELDTT